MTLRVRGLYSRLRLTKDDLVCYLPYHLLCLTFYADARVGDSSGSIVRTSFSP